MIVPLKISWSADKATKAKKAELELLTWIWDPNTWTVDLNMRSKHMDCWLEYEIRTHEKLKKMLLIRKKKTNKQKTCIFLGQSPLSSYKMTLKQQLNGDKWDAELGHICFWLSYVSFCVQWLEECSSCM